jgi:hypothetical protein
VLALWGGTSDSGGVYWRRVLAAGAALLGWPAVADLTSRWLEISVALHYARETRGCGSTARL